LKSKLLIDYQIRRYRKPPGNPTIVPPDDALARRKRRDEELSVELTSKPPRDTQNLSIRRCSRYGSIMCRAAARDRKSGKHSNHPETPHRSTHRTTQTLPSFHADQRQDNEIVQKTHAQTLVKRREEIIPFTPCSIDKCIPERQRAQAQIIFTSNH
jgi:hypothetical protein